MKELLFKRKSRFALYILACFIPVLDNFLINVSFSIIIGSIQRGDLDYFLRICLLAFGIVVLGSLMYVLSRFMRISFMRDILLDVRVLAFDKILSSSYVSFNKKSKDTYISNLINDINIFENNFFIQLINLVFKGGVYTVSLAVICFLDLKYALMAFLTSILLFIVSKSFEKTAKKEDGTVFHPARGKDFEFHTEIAVEDLSFSYDQKEIFKDVALRIEKGKKHLIKGGSGVGKSTLIKLLSMIYDARLCDRKKQPKTLYTWGF